MNNNILHNKESAKPRQVLRYQNTTPCQIMFCLLNLIRPHTYVPHGLGLGITHIGKHMPLPLNLTNGQPWFGLTPSMSKDLAMLRP